MLTTKFLKTSARLFSTQSIDGSGLLKLLQTQSNQSNLVVIDVREQMEIATTGKISDAFEANGITNVSYGEVTLNQIAEGGLNLPEDEFEDAFEFTKPSIDSTLIFSCAAGVRSATAQKIANNEGYKQTINYLGGANEWFPLVGSSDE